MVIKADIEQLRVQAGKLIGNIEEIRRVVTGLSEMTATGALMSEQTTDNEVFLTKTRELSQTIENIAKIAEGYKAALDDTGDKFYAVQCNAIERIKFADKKWFGL